MTSQRLVDDFARWLWERDTWPRDRFGDKDCRLPDSYMNEAAVFLAGELGQRLQHTREIEAMRKLVDDAALGHNFIHCKELSEILDGAS